MNKLINFFLQVGNLKNIKRTGWVSHGIPNAESVADHSFRTAILAAIFAKRLNLDELKSIKMSLFHDIAESKIGDIVTHDGKKKFANSSRKVRRRKSCF